MTIKSVDHILDESPSFLSQRSSTSSMNLIKNIKNVFRSVRRAAGTATDDDD